MQELFVEELQWEKVASAELEEDATQWPRQVLTELFRVLPEISEYVPEVKFTQRNEEQGYALGVVVITNTTNSALSASPSGASSPTPRALIPIVVKNGRLCPLDTLMASSGKMWPLTAERLREVLYRPESFELVTEDWGDNALWSMFAPPGSQGFGTGGNGLAGGAGGSQGGVQYMMGPGMGGMKMAMLDRIDGTVLAPDILRFEQALYEHENMKFAAVQNPAMLAYMDQLSKVATVTESTAAVYEQMLDDMRAVDVAIMTFDDRSGMYAVKTANRGVGLQRTRLLERGDFLRFAGDKIAARVDTEGTVVASAPGGAVLVSGPQGEKPKLIENSGIYTVYNAVTGAQLRGHVIVGLIDTDGERMPLSLFIHSHGASVQDQVSGTYASGSADREALPNDPPKGPGCFVVGDGDNRNLQATVEMIVQGSVSEPGATRYHCVDPTGAEVEVVMQAGMEGVVAFPNRRELVLPRSARFVSTGRPVAPLIEKAPGALDKTAAALLDGRVTVTATLGEQDAYQLAFRNLPKLAGALPDHSGLDFSEALYALCLSGLGPQDAFTALNKVASEGRAVISASDFGSRPMPPVEKIADHVVEVRMLHPHLVKEAAAMPDAMTVDAVLSLDFITSENVRTFISMIPYLEKALNKICELTFASRLGLSEIPEAATARAARGMNDAIRGLKSLALRQIDELP